MELATAAVAILGGFVTDLVDGREYVVCKLNFCNGGSANSGQTDSESSDTLFEMWCIENSIFSKRLL